MFFIYSLRNSDKSTIDTKYIQSFPSLSPPSASQTFLTSSFFSCQLMYMNMYMNMYMYVYSSDMYSSVSNWYHCYPHGQGAPTRTQSTYQWPQSHPKMNVPPPATINYQQLPGQGNGFLSSSLIHAEILTDLILNGSDASNHRCCEVMNATTIPCPKDKHFGTVFWLLRLLRSFFSIFSFFHTQDGICAWYCQLSQKPLAQEIIAHLGGSTIAILLN